MFERDFFSLKNVLLLPLSTNTLSSRFGYQHRENSRNAWREAGRLQTEMNQPFVQELHLLLEDQADLPVLKGLAHPDINKK